MARAAEGHRSDAVLREKIENNKRKLRMAKSKGNRSQIEKYSKKVERLVHELAENHQAPATCPAPAAPVPVAATVVAQPAPTKVAATVVAQPKRPSTPGLPEGWERKTAPDGRTYYVDHVNKRTSWEPPAAEAPLPAGWEKKTAPDGRTYYVDHNTKTTSWTPPGVATPQFAAATALSIAASGRRRALLVGCNYKGTRAELRGCINDVKRMRAFLLSKGFPPSEMLILTDDQQGAGRPTRQNMMKAIHWLVADSSKGDALFFHYSGHGGQEDDPDGIEEDGYNETIIPCDFQRTGQISDDILWRDLVDKVPDGCRLTSVMDCCHSGTGLDLPFTFDSSRGWVQDNCPAFSAGDVQMFSGCRDDQTSADVVANRQAGGAMTNAFLAVLDRHDDGDLQYTELMDKLHRELKRNRMSQRPQLSSSQRFDLRKRAFCLTDGFVPNGNSHLGRPPRQPGHKRKHKQGGALGGMDLESFLAGGGGAKVAMGLMGGLMAMAMAD
mmetsp:Transcript_10851/g.33474  ORF Transcript_10851/g.33474 Transcript_10851/m.33474 type:complete len:497 (+) Transcript_10851:310-1800(+)